MSSEKAAPPGTQQSDSARETTKSARRILIVDDNEDGARMLATLLELDDFQAGRRPSRGLGAGKGWLGD